MPLADDPAVGTILAKPVAARPPAPPSSVADAADRLGGSAPQIVIADARGAVLEHWTGYQVAWTMARDSFRHR